MKLTKRQISLLEIVKKHLAEQEWLEVLSYKKAFRDDLHALWSSGLIIWNQAGTHIQLAEKGK